MVSWPRRAKNSNAQRHPDSSAGVLPVVEATSQSSQSETLGAAGGEAEHPDALTTQSLIPQEGSRRNAQARMSREELVAARNPLITSSSAAPTTAAISPVSGRTVRGGSMHPSPSSLSTASSSHASVRGAPLTPLYPRLDILELQDADDAANVDLDSAKAGTIGNQHRRRPLSDRVDDAMPRVPQSTSTEAAVTAASAPIDSAPARLLPIPNTNLRAGASGATTSSIGASSCNSSNSRQKPLFGRPSTRHSLEDEQPDNVKKQAEQHIALQAASAAGNSSADWTFPSSSMPSASSGKRTAASMPPQGASFHGQQSMESSSRKPSLLDESDDDDEDESEQEDRKRPALTLAEVTATTTSDWLDSGDPVPPQLGPSARTASGATGTHTRQVSFAAGSKLPPVQEHSLPSDPSPHPASPLPLGIPPMTDPPVAVPSNTSTLSSSFSSTTSNHHDAQAAAAAYAMPPSEMEQARADAGDLRRMCGDAGLSNSSPVAAESLQILISMCQSYLDKVVRIITTALADEVDVDHELWLLSDVLNRAISMGTAAVGGLGNGEDPGLGLPSNPGSSAAGIAELRPTVSTDSTLSAGLASAVGSAAVSSTSLRDGRSQLVATGASLLRSLSIGSGSTVGSHPVASSSSLVLDIVTMVENQDVFSLICMLRSQQAERRLDAAYALMKFAKDDDSAALRRQICSSGGFSVLLSLVRSPTTQDEAKILMALTVSYLLPVVDKLTVSNGITAVECLRLLSKARRITPNGHIISEDECRQAAAKGMLHFWINHLEPMMAISSGSGSLNLSSNADLFAPSDVPSMIRGTSMVSRIRQSRMSSASAGRARGGLLDQRRESIELAELLENTVSLIVRTVKPSRNGDRAPALDCAYALVEAVCYVEAARAIAVREGILETLVCWIQSKERDKIAPAASALRYLTSIKDSYMAGWIHSQMVNEGALKCIVDLFDSDCQVVGSDVQLSVAQILSSLCVAPHTRAAVEKADGVSLLIQFLDPPSQAGALYAGGALVQLASGAITRAAVFGDEMLDSASAGNGVVDAIIDQGGIEYFVAIARSERGKLRSMAVEGIRVLSEDVSPRRLTRAKLCRDGAVEALGISLRDGVEATREFLRNDAPATWFKQSEVRDIRESLSALGNILDPLPEGVSVGYHLAADGMDIPKLLLGGCKQTAESGGLEALLFVTTLGFLPPDESPVADSATEALILLEEACRTMVAIAPLLLSERLAASGEAVWADQVLKALCKVAAQLAGREDLSEAAKEAIDDIQVYVLRCLGALALYEPLKIRIVDRLLAFVLAMSDADDGRESSNAASQTIQVLGLSDDEVATQVSGSNVQLLADWFCLKRSSIIQALAHDEIRILLSDLWGKPFERARSESSVRRLMHDGPERGASRDVLFPNFPDKVSAKSRFESSKTRDDFVREYKEVYGSSGLSPEDGGLLVQQAFPLDSAHNEAAWILAHNDVMQQQDTLQWPGVHCDELLRRVFPSQLIRNHIVPWNNLRPNASFRFRGLMMPQRRYFSFRREGQLLSRLFQVESAPLEGNGVHWSLVFANSSFAGEFSDSLVQALYLCPMISGLSFSLPLPSDGSNDSDENVDDGGAGMLSNLVGSLPPWISCLTFDGVLSNSEMETLVKVLKTVGLLTAGLVIHKGATSDKDDQRQGRFGCLAIRNSTKIEKGVWRSLFRLLGRTDGSAVSEPPRPLARLKVLDLSGNKLGDELCAAVLLLAHDRGSGCMLEELDLSGNCINAATHMLKVLREYLLHHRHKHHSGGKRSKSRWKSHLHTLLLAANGLQEDRAWLKMVDLLKGDALELEVLDLSDNGLVLGDHDDDLCGSLSSALLKNTCLRRLNLSRNKFSPLAVDRLLCDLDAATNSVLSFVEFHDNEPAFSENQLRLLASFVGRSRQNLLQRVMSADQDDAGRSVDWKPGDADISVAEGAVSVSSVPRDSAMNPEVAMRDNMITVLFSAPLIYRRTDEIIMPFEKLDFAKEREILWQCLKEASLEGSDEINLVFDTATTDRLLAVITKRCSCLHYSGHGFTDRLPFEMAGEKFGQPDWQHVDMIRRLISQGDGAAFRFVFVSACFSFSMGAAFVKAGVPHVVCCDEGAALKDSAALLFTRQFYLSLALGSTVKASFDQGCKAVLAQHPEEEMRKFRLLPEGDRLHDESIFPSTGRRSRRGSHRAPHAAGTKALDLRVQNKIQEDPGPSPPECFLGREVDMYHVLARLMDKSNRLVSVYGVPGVGRASLVKALCHYINERASTIDFKQIYYVKASREKRAVALMRRLMNQLIQADKLSGDTAPASAASHDHSDIEIITDLVCRSLKSERVLIVFERVDLLEDADEFPITLKTLLSETRSLKVLLTNRQRLGIASIAEKYFELGPLTLGNTVHLFAQKCQNLHTRQERHRLVEALLAEADQVDLLPGADDLTDSSARIFSCMGFGIPSLIERAAYSISKEVFLSMMNGSFLEPDNQAAAVGVEEIPDDGHSAA